MIRCLSVPFLFAESSVKSKVIQEGLYTRRDLSPNFTLFWRILHDLNEIEVVMKTKGTGYAALGWRPAGATKSCQAWPPLGEGGEGHGHHHHGHGHHHHGDSAEGREDIAEISQSTYSLDIFVLISRR